MRNLLTFCLDRIFSRNFSVLALKLRWTLLEERNLFMGFGITAALSGAKARELQLEVLANNIANIQTTGFKELSVAFATDLNNARGISDELAQTRTSVKEGKTFINFRQGSLHRTGNPTNFAIQGSGYFVVQTPEGNRYTRNGNFTLDGTGTLITTNGHPVLTGSGPVTIPTGSEISLGTDGELSVNQESLGKLWVVDFIDKQNLKPVGNNYFSADGVGKKQNFNFTVVQGHLENSNVRLVSNMTRIIQVSRAYEALQKTIKQQTEASKMLNQLAKIT